jgi:hypothetical protein
VSRYFSTVAEGFHLKEWTYAELLPVLEEHNFADVRLFWQASALLLALPLTYFMWAERVNQIVPAPMRRFMAKLLVPSICCAATKHAERFHQ